MVRNNSQRKWQIYLKVLKRTFFLFHFFEIRNVFGYGKYLNLFVFYVLSRDEFVILRIWFQSHHNEMNQIIHFRSSFWLHYRQKVSSIPVFCSIRLWQDEFFWAHYLCEGKDLCTQTLFVSQLSSKHCINAQIQISGTKK